MGKTKPRIVGTKTVEFFINKKGGVKKEEVIKGLMEVVNLDRKSAEASVDQAIRFGALKEKNGKLFEIGRD